jgi:hypothetical protein
MIRLLVILIVAAVIAYFTNPNADAYRGPVREALQASADQAMENLDIVGAAESGFAQLGGDGDYQTFYVASKYSAPSQEHAIVECWGAFTIVRCMPAASPASS